MIGRRIRQAVAGVWLVCVAALALWGTAYVRDQFGDIAGGWALVVLVVGLAFYRWHAEERDHERDRRSFEEGRSAGVRLREYASEHERRP